MNLSVTQYTNYKLTKLNTIRKTFWSLFIQGWKENEGIEWQSAKLDPLVSHTDRW